VCTASFSFPYTANAVLKAAEILAARAMICAEDFGTPAEPSSEAVGGHHALGARSHPAQPVREIWGGWVYPGYLSSVAKSRRAHPLNDLFSGYAGFSLNQSIM
jgi:hypothetical protein